jgi:hypothetical protein
MTDPKGSPCETFIQGAPRLDEEERGSHHLWIIGHELKGLNICQAYDLFASSLAHIWDYCVKAILNVENTFMMPKTGMDYLRG